MPCPGRTTESTGCNNAGPAGSRPRQKLPTRVRGSRARSSPPTRRAIRSRVLRTTAEAPRRSAPHELDAPAAAYHRHRRVLQPELPPLRFPGPHLQALVVLHRRQGILQLLVGGVGLHRAREDLLGAVLLL